MSLQVLVTLWYSIVPVCILTLLSGYIFYANNYEKPALWIAIYSVFIRSMWGLAISILVTGIALGTGCKLHIFPHFLTISRLSSPRSPPFKFNDNLSNHLIE